MPVDTQELALPTPQESGELALLFRLLRWSNELGDFCWSLLLCYVSIDFARAFLRWTPELVILSIIVVWAINCGITLKIQRAVSGGALESFCRGQAWLAGSVSVLVCGYALAGLLFGLIPLFFGVLLIPASILLAVVYRNRFARLSEEIGRIYGSDELVLVSKYVRLWLIASTVILCIAAAIAVGLRGAGTERLIGAALISLPALLTITLYVIDSVRMYRVVEGVLADKDV